MSKLCLCRILARYRKRIGSGDQFVKASEYKKEYGTKNASQVPGTDMNIYERPSAVKNSWQKTDLPTETITSYKRQFPGAGVASDKLGKDKEIRAGLKDRNGNIIGNNYASMESLSHVKRSFLSPEPQLRSKDNLHAANSSSHSRIGSGRSIGVSFPYGYRSRLDGITTYKDTFIDHHVKHCNCPN